jgi:hypothetical protein
MACNGMPCPGVAWLRRAMSYHVVASHVVAWYTVMWRYVVLWLAMLWKLQPQQVISWCVFVWWWQERPLAPEVAVTASV